MPPTESDLFPVYDSQDLSAFAVLMAHRAASHLGLTHSDSNFEDDMRNSLKKARPEVLALIDQVMDAYRAWIEAISPNASATVRGALQARIEKLCAELSAAVSS